MPKYICIDEKISPFNKTIQVSADKSLSIRTILLASQAVGTSKISNLLESEDVLNALKVIKKLGIDYKKTKDFYKIYGFGLNGFDPKNNTVINAGNSGTLGRLILSLLIKTKKKIKLIGDKSLSKRDFSRVTIPLKKFGAKFSSNSKLPLYIKGLKNPKPINYFEKKGSAQVKTSLIMAALKTKGLSKIKAKKSRTHTEIMLKNLKIPIKIKKTKNFDYIQIRGVNKISPLHYNIPGDISSSAFFLVLTILSKNSELLIKNININPSRTGIIKILKRMRANIRIVNKKIYKGESVGDILVKSSNNLKSINCPTKYNTSAIDEFLVIFLVAAKSKGISYFKNLSELNHKESPRLYWGSKILNLMGVKNIVTNDSIKIYGNPNLKIKRKIHIKNYLKDHRIFMMSVIAGLTFGGSWKINDQDSIKTSFPSFLKILRKIR